MSSTMLGCDQAIFTSTRTRMGEGYRLIAASRGLRPAERQVITRSSPSHDGLCQGSTDAGALPTGPCAMAFYPLPSGRLCVAMSCLAGEEHTGRGGQRVYTHIIIVEPQDFPRWQYNPFHLLRAMIAAGLNTPNLKAPAVLPKLELEVAVGPTVHRPVLHPAMDSALCCYLLQGLFENRAFIVNLQYGWLQSTEALLLGVPGPMRANISFDAGLKFSVGRIHRLHFLLDATEATRTRTVGQPVEYLNPKTSSTPESPRGAWLSFVDRHWRARDLDLLARRTSRGFGDVSPAGRERIADLYTKTDEIDRTDTSGLLMVAGDVLHERRDSVEQEIAAEFLDAAHRVLLGRFGGPWHEVFARWHLLVQLLRRSEKACSFAQPLVQKALHTAMRDDPVAAGWAALDLARELPPGINKPVLDVVFDEIPERLAAWIQRTADFEPDAVLRLCDQWEVHISGNSILDQIRGVCATVA